MSRTALESKELQKKLHEAKESSRQLDEVKEEKQLEPLCPLCFKQSLSLFGSKDDWEKLELYCTDNYCNGKYNILVKSLATELKFP